jgi:hypothetical protein
VSIRQVTPSEKPCKATRGTTSPGYTLPFYKADRIAEYRQAHAAFKKRMNADTRNR